MVAGGRVWVWLLVAALTPAVAQAQTPGQFVSDSKTGCKFWWPDSLNDSTIRSFHWAGACAKGLASGHGTFEAIVHLASDTTWKGEGEATEGKLNGRAFMTASSGYRVEGEYRDGVLNGRGIFTEDTEMVKGRYEGEFRNGKREGTGVRDEQQFLGGPPLLVHFVGEYKDDKEIKGLLIQREQGCSAEERYEGEMTNGKYNVRGTLKAADGKIYSGIWNMGRINVGGREISTWDIKGVPTTCDAMRR